MIQRELHQSENAKKKVRERKYEEESMKYTWKRIQALILTAAMLLAIFCLPAPIEAEAAGKAITVAAMYEGTVVPDYNCKISIVYGDTVYSGYGYVTISEEIYSQWSGTIDHIWEFPGEYIYADLKWIPDYFEVLDISVRDFIREGSCYSSLSSTGKEKHNPAPWEDALAFFDSVSTHAPTITKLGAENTTEAANSNESANSAIGGRPATGTTSQAPENTTEAAPELPPDAMTDEEDVTAEQEIEYPKGESPETESQAATDATEAVQDGSAGGNSGSRGDDYNGNGIPDDEEEDFEHTKPARDPEDTSDNGQDGAGEKQDEEDTYISDLWNDLMSGASVSDNWQNGSMSGQAGTGAYTHIQDAGDHVFHVQIQGKDSILPEGTEVRITEEQNEAYLVKMASIYKVLESKNIRFFDINLQDSQGNAMHDLGGAVAVRMDVPQDYEVAEGNTVVVYHMPMNGQPEICLTEYNNEDPDDRYVVFMTDHFSLYLFAEQDMNQAEIAMEHLGPKDDQSISTGQDPMVPGDGVITDETLTDSGQQQSGSMLVPILGVAAIILIAGAGILVIKKKK